MAVFIVLKHWRQPKYPTIREYLNKYSNGPLKPWDPV